MNQILENRGYIQASSVVGSVVDEVAGLKATSTKQTTIRDFSTSKHFIPKPIARNFLCDCVCCIHILY